MNASKSNRSGVYELSEISARSMSPPPPEQPLHESGGDPSPAPPASPPSPFAAAPTPSSYATRAATVQDLPAILEIYAPYVESSYISFEYEPPALDEMTSRFFRVTESLRLPYLVAYDRARPLAVLGYAYLTEFRGRPGWRITAEIAVYVSSQLRAKGVGSALYEALLLEARRVDKYPDLQNVIATIGHGPFPEAHNFGSLRLHEKFGFSVVAHLPRAGLKFNRYVDVVMMQLSLREVSADDSAPPLFSYGNAFQLPVNTIPWEPDDLRDTCTACGAAFIFIFRQKHHCRCCGRIFCDDCTNYRSAVPKWKITQPTRVCHMCYLELLNTPSVSPSSTPRLVSQSPHAKIPSTQTPPQNSVLTSSSSTSTSPSSSTSSSSASAQTLSITPHGISVDSASSKSTSIPSSLLSLASTPTSPTSTITTTAAPISRVASPAAIPPNQSTFSPPVAAQPIAPAPFLKTTLSSSPDPLSAEDIFGSNEPTLSRSPPTGATAKDLVPLSSDLESIFDVPHPASPAKQHATPAKHRHLHTPSVLPSDDPTPASSALISTIFQQDPLPSPSPTPLPIQPIDHARSAFSADQGYTTSDLPHAPVVDTLPQAFDNSPHDFQPLSTESMAHPAESFAPSPDPHSPVGRTFNVLFDFQPETDYELQLTTGQSVLIIGIDANGTWVQGRTLDGHEGWFPSNYISI